MNRLKIIAVLLLAALLPTACGNLNDNKKISIAYANWSEGIAMSYLNKSDIGRTWLRCTDAEC